MDFESNTHREMNKDLLVSAELLARLEAVSDRLGSVNDRLGSKRKKFFTLEEVLDEARTIARLKRRAMEAITYDDDDFKQYHTA